MSGRVGQDDFQCRPNFALEKMTAARRAVGKAQNDVDMKARFAVVADFEPGCLSTAFFYNSRKVSAQRVWQAIVLGVS